MTHSMNLAFNEPGNVGRVFELSYR
jgi:hypothetical protein